MTRKITFLFYHYGKIPDYLSHAIEHVRIFNPESEIILITESVKDTSMLDRLDILIHQMDEFESAMLKEFERTYRHISSYNEKYERFCFKRWFVTEVIRKSDPDKIYVMMDSDVAVFGDAAKIMPSLPDCPISICGGSPHFSYIKGSADGFLQYVLDFYSDSRKVRDAMSLHLLNLKTEKALNLTDNSFLPSFMKEKLDVQNYNSDSDFGYIDTNIHVPEGFDSNKLRRRSRKKIFWKEEDGLVIPYFKRNGRLVRAFILHFQGPGKRVFYRFNELGTKPSKIKIWCWNQVFQQRWLADLM